MKKILLSFLVLTCLLALTGPLAPAQEKPKMTGLTIQDRQAWHQLLKWPQAWEEEFKDSLMWSEDLASDGRMQFFPLETGKYLVEIMIAMGAYQGTYGYLFYDETTSPPAAKPLSFKIFNTEQGKILAREVQEMTGFGDFKADSKELLIAGVYRGLGDCGYTAVYRISDGKAVLQEFRAKFDCDGHSPEKFPLIFQAKNRR
jgi:hypothetical protein